MNREQIKKVLDKMRGLNESVENIARPFTKEVTTKEEADALIKELEEKYDLVSCDTLSSNSYVVKASHLSEAVKSGNEKEKIGEIIKLCKDMGMITLDDLLRFTKENMGEKETLERALKRYLTTLKKDGWELKESVNTLNKIKTLLYSVKQSTLSLNEEYDVYAMETLNEFDEAIDTLIKAYSSK